MARGYGTGWVTAIATVRGHGSFGMAVSIYGGWWGGDFVNAMERLGQALAEHLAERRRAR